MKRADVFIREMEKYLPKMYRSLMLIYQNLDEEDEAEIIKEQYELIDGISVDFGIMQKTRKAYVIKCEFIWDDIGSFAALARYLVKDRSNNISGNTYLEQSQGCSVLGRDRLIIGFGIKDLIIIDAGDVIMVMDKNKDQEIKHLVNQLKGINEMEKYI